MYREESRSQVFNSRQGREIKEGPSRSGDPGRLRPARSKDLGPQRSMKGREGKALAGQAGSLVPTEASVSHSLGLMLDQPREGLQRGPEVWGIGLAARTEGL